MSSAGNLEGYDRNVLGRASALTVMSAVKPLWVPLLKLLFFVGTHVPALLRTLRKLSFIHFARWTLVDEIPTGGSGERERLRHTYLFFESNYNGTWSQYIDAFSYVVPQHIEAIWKSSYGFSGAVPAHPFKKYITAHEYTAEHYYSAYPEASATMVLSALELRHNLDRLRRNAFSMSPDEFDETWRRFLTDNQRHL
ncbi:MAG: hypothetical protein M3433_03120 [Actinomycetota bacterium]|nr:hypothetical protein [Actinomycetota bacterium]